MRKDNLFIDLIDHKFGRFKSLWKRYFNIDFFDSMNLLLFVLGTLLLIICYLHKIVRLSEFVTTEILFLTFIAILQYTKETFHLRDIQQKTLNQQRIGENYKLMPFLEFRFSYTDEKFLTIFNKGKGLAKKIILIIKYGDETYNKQFFAIDPGGIAKLSDLRDHKFLSSFGSMSDELLTKIEIRGEYSDIANRDYRFKVIFARNEDSFEITDSEQEPSNWSIKKGLF